MRLGVGIVVGVLVVTACAAPDPPTGRSTAPSTTTAVTAQSRSDDSLALLAPLLVTEPGCSAAVGIDGVVVWAGARGMADLAAKVEMTTGTVFDIASVSKQFTATAVLLMAQDGRLDLDDTVATHLDGLPQWAERITITQLIHHSSGIPEFIELLHARGVEFTDLATQEQAVQAVAETPTLDFEPGTTSAYSNSNYLLLAEIVHAVSGQPLPQFLAARIFQPLGLNMIMDEAAAVPGKAVSYDRKPGRQDFPVLDTPWTVIGPGGIQTTPSELVRWADNYRTGQLGGQALLQAQLADPVPFGNGDDHYAAGIIIERKGILSHNGNWEGFNTEFVISADRHTAVAVTCNAYLPRALSTTLLRLWT
ncbi:MAG TPA: serine hydrolase domain-containing protein [Pseudonocardiaceae bacterium]